MIDRGVLVEVDRFMTAERKKRYIDFCRYVIDKCDLVKQELGPNVISRVYSRLDKQDGEQLKTNLKIAQKVNGKRSEGEKFGPADVTDIVGVTLVVQYPDQIGPVLKKLREFLDARDITFKKVEDIEKRGYFATHVDLFSEVNHWHAHCELQIKTMLHDSWSAKMHDLNYKPRGSLDNRLDRLMASLGNTLQAIEVQSETLRNLIQERWQQDRFWRQLVGKKTIDQLKYWSMKKGLFDEEAQEIFKAVDEAEEQIIKWNNNPDKLFELTKLVSQLSQKTSRRAWWIATYLAVLSRRPQNEELAIGIIQEWLVEGAALLREPNHGVDSAELFFAPLACQALGYNDVAISFSEEIVQTFSELSVKSVIYPNFNLAHFLIEREYFAPSNAEARAAVADRVKQLREECEEMRCEDPSSFHDLEGMEKVVFGTTASEVRDGIRLIELGKNTTNDQEAQFAADNYELHARLAWRRLAEIENFTG